MPSKYISLSRPPKLLVGQLEELADALGMTVQAYAGKILEEEVRKGSICEGALKNVDSYKDEYLGNLHVPVADQNMKSAIKRMAKQSGRMTINRETMFILRHHVDSNYGT